MSELPEISSLFEMFDVDFDSGVLIWKNAGRHHRNIVGKSAGTPIPNNNGKVYWTVRINRRGYKRSRLIYAMAKGEWPADQVDHVNGDSTDDRISNLRSATVTQNAWNHKHRARRVQLPMGVRRTSSGRYQARIACNKSMHHLGTFETPEQASERYQQARKEYFHEFA